MAKAKDRYAIIVFFGDGGWNILLQENCDNKYYFSSDEHDLDDSLDTLDLFLENGGDIFQYKVPSYDTWADAVSDDEIFELPPKVIPGLEQYLTNPKMVVHFPATNGTNCPNCDCSILENEQNHCKKCGYYFRYEINELNRS